MPSDADRWRRRQVDAHSPIAARLCQQRPAQDNGRALFLPLSAHPLRIGKEAQLHSRPLSRARTTFIAHFCRPVVYSKARADANARALEGSQ